MFRSIWYVTRSTGCFRRRTASAAAPASRSVASRNRDRASSNVSRSPPRTCERVSATRREPPRPGTGAFGRTAGGAAMGGASDTGDTSAFPAGDEGHAREGWQVGRRDEAMLVRAAVELGKALLVLGLEVMVKVSVEVFGEDLARHSGADRRGVYDLGPVRPRVLTRPEERLRRHGGPHRPYREHERQAREPAPAFREVEHVEPGEVGFQRRIPDEEGGVVVREHLAEVRRGGVELGMGTEEVAEEDSRHRGRRTGCDVQSHGLRGLDRLATDENDAPHPLAGRDP